MLKNINNKYNNNIDKTYIIDNIILKDYETFEKIIKKIDKNELNDTKITQYFTDIDTTKDNICNWLQSVSEQNEIYNTIFND